MESGEKEEEQSSLAQFQDLLKEWDSDHSQQHYDPTKLLERMAEILERETNVYMASDPGRADCEEVELTNCRLKHFQIPSRRDIRAA